MLWIGSAFAATITVDGTLQAALAQAQAGDVIVVPAGTYEERVETIRAGTEGAPIRVVAEGEVIVTAPGEVIEIGHAWMTFEGLIFDGQLGDADTVDVEGTADHLQLVDVEVRNSGRDCIDIDGIEGGGPTDVLVEGALIHHCLYWDGGREDAHGITGGAVQGLRIVDTEIHTFSGDAVQLDPGRSEPGWSDLSIEGCTFWAAPLDEDIAGFPAGMNPAENAIDTKTWDSATERAELSVTDTVAHGFRFGEIDNMAAFNIKEGVSAHFDRVLVYESEIAFRVRGPTRDMGAEIRVDNVWIHNVDVGFRYEDDIEVVQVRHGTFGPSVGEAFHEASSDNTVPEVANCLFEGALPEEATGSSNLSVEDIEDVSIGPDHPAVDAGEELGVATDFEGEPRPSGPAPDVGADELQAAGSPDTGDTGDPRPPHGDTSCGCASGASGALILLLATATIRRRRRGSAP